jgi:RNA polymerase nonessential primary-like sigma factor
MLTMPTAMTRPQTQRSKSREGDSADLVRAYLHEIGRVPLLTDEQEIILGKQVQQMMRLLDRRSG